jgi:hypothetical protein
MGRTGDKNSPAPTFEPLPATNILQRKPSLPPQEPPEELIDVSNSYQSPITSTQNPYFDPFQTVFDKDPEEDVTETTVFNSQPIVAEVCGHSLQSTPLIMHYHKNILLIKFILSTILRQLSIHS